jgi:hypothetical protein
MRRVSCCALLLFLLIPIAAHADESGNFLVKIGSDTLLLEKLTRSKKQVKGEYVTRTPRSAYRTYTLDLGPDGFVKKFELISRPLGPTPGRETRSTVEFMGDSAITTAPRGDTTVTTRLAAPRGSAPFVYGIMALVEQLGRQALAAGGTSYKTMLVSPGSTSPLQATVNRGGGDTLLLYTENATSKTGPWVFRLDKAGNLISYSGLGTTFQAETQRLAKLDLEAAKTTYATRPLGQLSMRDTTRGKVGDADVWVDYGRPSKRDREIFGNVVPWGQVWRTGANAATQFHTSADLVIGDTDVPAGTYTLWTLPSQTGWKLIINKQTGQWGTEYHPEQDLARIDVKSEPLMDPVELLTIAVAPRADGAQLQIEWDKTRLSVPIRRKV